MSNESKEAMAEIYYLDAKYPHLDTYLRLTDYEAANLYWCLTEIMNGNSTNLNTGDWVGQIRFQLLNKMKSSGFDKRQYSPNKKFTKPLTSRELEIFGEHNGPTSEVSKPT